MKNIHSENTNQDKVFEELGVSIKLPLDWKVKRDFTITKYNYIAESPITENGEYNSVYLSYEYIPQNQFENELDNLIKSISEIHKMKVEVKSDCELKEYNCKKILASSRSLANLTYIISKSTSEKTYIITATTFYKEKKNQLEKLEAIIKQIRINDSQEISKGHEIYIQQCASCHGLKMDQNLTGPALKGISERRKLKWIKSFINDSQLMYENRDSIAVDIINLYGGQQIRCGSGKKRELKEDEIEAIIKYIEYEANNAT